VRCVFKANGWGGLVNVVCLASDNGEAGRRHLFNGREWLSFVAGTQISLVYPSASAIDKDRRSEAPTGNKKASSSPINFRNLGNSTTSQDGGHRDGERP
jgi:hypothetical protein